MQSKLIIYLFVIVLVSILFESCKREKYAHWFDNSKDFILNESNIKVKLPEDFERIDLNSIRIDSVFKNYIKTAIEVFNPNDGIVETYLDKASTMRIVCFIQDTTFYKSFEHHDSYSPFDTMKIYIDTIQQYSPHFKLSKYTDVIENYEVWHYYVDLTPSSDYFYPQRFFQSNFMIPFKKELITVIEFSDDNNHQEQRLMKYLKSIFIYNEK